MILHSFLCSLLVLGIAGSPIPKDSQKLVTSIQHHQPSNLVRNSGIPEEFVNKEAMAYNTCESYRGKLGLTWKDVEICEKKFETQAIEEGVYVPTYQDFMAADQNKDGLVTYEEWMGWVVSGRKIIKESKPVDTTTEYETSNDFPRTTYYPTSTTISPLAEDLKPAETMAFHNCESYRGKEGLTWNDVEACEERFQDEASERGLYLPTYQDFMAADQDYDGMITFEEWKQWVWKE